MKAPSKVKKRQVRVQTGGGMTARFYGTSSAYEAGSSTSQELAAWNPQLSEANDELGSRDRITARVRDIERNDSIAMGGIDRRVNATVGAEMWVSARPDWAGLGMTMEAGLAVGRQMEAVFRRWADDPWFFNDVEGELTFSQQIELAFMHFARENECVAVIYGSEPTGLRRFATQVRIVDPDLLSTPVGRTESPTLRNGIEMTVNGRPIAYWFEREHPNASVRDPVRSMQWVRVPRYARSGRPQVIHYYGKRRAGLKRGISQLAAGLKRFKQLSRYTDAELSAQLLGAMLPLFIKSKSPSTAFEALAPAGSDADQSYSDQRAEFHEKSNLTFAGSRIAALFENEELDSVDTRRTGADFEKFQAVALRALAPIFGITYEQLSNDWGNVNYSSARAALIEIWRSIDADRARFTRRFCTPIYQAVIWEAVVRGIIVLPPGAPDFLENMALYTRCRWIGPGRGWVDPVKEATGAGMRMDRFLSDPESEAAEQGEDLIENMQNVARLKREAEALGLQWPGGMTEQAPANEQADEPAAGRQRRQNG